MKPLDINCDLGEGMADDAALMPFISSCNIACGGHAGDEGSMRRVVRLAMEQGVAIGAHPSFEDKANFGRRELDVPPDVLQKSLIRQIRSLKAIVEEEKGTLHHVKPHGALYNLAARSAETSQIIVQAIESVDSRLMLYGMAGSEMQLAAKGKLPFVPEAFADRTYDFLTRLTPRAKGGVLTDLSAICRRVHEFHHGYIVTTRGTFHTDVQTVCVHSDTPGSKGILQSVHTYLQAQNIPVQAP